MTALLEWFKAVAVIVIYNTRTIYHTVKIYTQ